MLKKLFIIGLGLYANFSHATDFMDGNWANDLCVAWNKTDALYNTLGHKWAKNTKDRGYRIIRLYRDKCNKNSAVQLIIEPKAGHAVCTYGGNLDIKPVNLSVDYVLSATDSNWECFGNGTLGCKVSGALSTGKLYLLGNKEDALKHIHAFNTFLKLTGTVPGDKKYCDYQAVIAPVETQAAKAIEEIPSKDNSKVVTKSKKAISDNWPFIPRVIKYD